MDIPWAWDTKSQIVKKQNLYMENNKIHSSDKKPNIKNVSIKYECKKLKLPNVLKSKSWENMKPVEKGKKTKKHHGILNCRYRNH